MPSETKSQEDSDFKISRPNFWRDLIMSLLGLLFIVIFAIRIEWSELFSLSIEWHFLLMALLLMLVSLFLRGLRVYLAIKPLHGSVPLKRFVVTFITGYGIGILFPAKTGDLGAVEVFNRGAKIAPTHSLAAMLIVRLSDVIVIGTSFTLILYFFIPDLLDDNLTDLSDERKELILVALNSFVLIIVIIMILLVLIINIPAFGHRTFGVIDRLLSFMKLSFWANNKDRVEKGISDFYSSTKKIQQSKSTIFFIYLSSITRWILEGYAVVLLSHSLSTRPLTLIEGLGAISVSVVVGMVTFTPAGIGGGTLSSALFMELVGLTSTEAGALTLLNTFMGPFFVILLGIICFPSSRRPP